MFDNLFTQSTILEAGMQATNYKNDALMQNMANVDTPGYQQKTVNFESSLAKAIEKTKSTGENHMGDVMSDIYISIKTDSTTLDGNTIDIETAMMELYKNSMRYDTIVGSVQSNSQIKSSIYSTFA
ncbi:MAG: flagellar basal body rod protein FlgB [bacterium]